MENVSGILSQRGKPFVEALVTNMTEAGYTLQQKKLTASEYGVPQDRKRVIIIGELTEGKEGTFSYPKPIGGSKKTGGSKGMASANRIIPAKIDEKLRKEVEEVAVKAFKAVGLSGVVRIDFLVDKKKNKVFINEINACPGSLAFYLWEAKDKSFTNLLDDMINIAIKSYKKEKAKVRSFDTNILSGFNGLKGSKGKLGKFGKLR